MRRIEIESLALSVIDRALKGQPAEDLRAELKTTFIEAKKAARRIAAHANAAGGEPVLWLIGVDEATPAVPGVNAENFADWWSSVKSCFDGAYPHVDHLAFEYDGQSVVALLFETDLAPFVVKVQDGGGPVSREVPWREGTSVDSATRLQLIRLLVPVVRSPKLEIVKAHLDCLVNRRIDGNQPFNFRLSFRAECFLVQRQEQNSTLTAHRTAISLEAETYKPEQVGDVAYATVPLSRGEMLSVLTLQGPSKFIVTADIFKTVSETPSIPGDAVFIRMRFAIPDCDRDVVADCRLSASTPPGHHPEPGMPQKWWDYSYASPPTD